SAGTTLGNNLAVGAASSFTTPAFNIRDNYGVNRSVTMNYIKTAADTWQATLNDTVSGKSFAATSTMDLSGANISPTQLTFNWVPETTTGAQNVVAITMSTTSMTIGAAGNVVGTVAAANGGAQAAFDPANASTYNNSTSLSTFDSLGSEHLTTMYFRQTNQANQWEVYTYSDGVLVPTGGNPSESLIFSTAGLLATPAAPSTVTIDDFNPGGGAALMSIKLDVADLTQYGSVFSVNALVQDGFTTGRLSGIDISDTGVVTARFTNGQSRTLAQVALANFSNAQGLRQLGDTSWAESFESGAALVGSPGSGSLGLIQSGALEGSNVDLTEQLVNMITAQRNFQANAQVITTSDTVTQTIINIR
ncbi:MAG: flagellar hook-basal body complex protein, partial [Gammaproteobacteria bacterium]|nr:flagellar hook-basal body complex protein [Gammaproteobacteria bacterium]